MAAKLRALVGLYVVGLVACAQAPRSAPPPKHVEPAPEVVSPPFIDDRPLITETGRVFFATAYETMVQMLWVRKVDNDTYLEVANDISSAGRFKVVETRGDLLRATHGEATLEARLNADGSFSGELKRETGQLTIYTPTRYVPVTSELSEPVGFVGFLPNGTRYRLLFSAHGNDVSGIARFPDTRVDLVVRGTLDRARRRVLLEEMAPSGTVQSRLDLTLLWLAAKKPDEIVFPLLDGAPLRLDTDMHDPYPHRVILKGGAGLVAQESYDEDCGVAADMVFPSPEGVDASVAKKIQSSLQKWMQRGYERFAKSSPDDPLQALDHPAKFVPGTRRSADDCKRKERQNRVMHGDTYSALPLLDDWIAVEMTHYTNMTGVTDAGTVRHDCVIVDLTTGSVSEPSALLTDDARARIRARASGIDVSQRPLCIGASDVRLKAPQSVFGREEDVVWTRKDFAALLPEGPLRKHLAQ